MPTVFISSHVYDFLTNILILYYQKLTLGSIVYLMAKLIQLCKSKILYRALLIDKTFFKGGSLASLDVKMFIMHLCPCIDT